MWVERDGIAVNLMRVRAVTKNGGSIWFVENDNFTSWKFDDIEERDEIYDWLLGITKPARKEFKR